RDRVESGEADLVDRDRGDGHRDPGRDRRLPGRDLPRAGLQHLSHDHVVDLAAGDACPVERGLDRDAAELGRTEAAERAEQPPDRRSGTAGNYRVAHGCNDTSGRRPEVGAAAMARRDRRYAVLTRIARLPAPG